MCTYGCDIVSCSCVYRSFMENTGPLMGESAKKSGVSAKQVVEEVLSATGGRRLWFGLSTISCLTLPTLKLIENCYMQTA